MFSEILSKYLETRYQSLSAPAVLSVKVDGITYSSTEWTSAHMSLNGASSAFHPNAEVHGILECDGVSGPFSGEIVGDAEQPLDIRFRTRPANVLMMLNMARAA